MIPRLQMIQKPPVVFTMYDPAAAISKADYASAFSTHRNNPFPWLWISYARTVLADVDPCMEANEGAEATLAILTRIRKLSELNVKSIDAGEGYVSSYELGLGEARLYLSESVEGEVHLYFLSPEKYYNRRDECRMDLSDYGSDPSARFIATMFSASSYLWRSVPQGTLFAFAT